jgi:ABC-type uncharacterized transport system permease subunit
VPDIVIHVIASAAYVGLAWHFWNTRWQRRTTIAQAAPTGLRSWERTALLVPLALHGWILYRSMVGETELRFGFAQALSATVWLGVAIYWIESFFMHLDGLEPLLLPAAAVALFLPMAFPGRISPQSLGNAEFAFHLLFFILAFGVLTIAIVHVAMLSFLERDLHRSGGAAAPRRPSLPPVLTLERLLFHLIALSFVLLTIGLAIGVALSESLFGRAMRFDHKTLFSVLAWLTLAVLLVGRHAYGWRGRTALRWTTAGFIFLLLAYVGRSFVLEVLLGRS